MVARTQYQRRESSFELIRIVAQFMIVIYHLFLFFMYPMYGDIFYKAVQIPLHIGVLLFVLISGYFGIKTSAKGFLKLIGVIAIYYIPINIINIYLQNGGGKEIVKSFLFISHTPYWFMRSYICLYLFAPVLNTYLKQIDIAKRICLLSVLAFISIYLGTLNGDPSLAGGKNLAHFSLLYCIGDTLHRYKSYWSKFNRTYLILTYIALNFILVFMYMIFKDQIIGKIIWRLSYPYCSPMLLLNALLLFVILGNLRFHSKLVNWIASSTLAIYLIHSHPFVLEYIGNLIPWIGEKSFNMLAFILFLVLYSLIIMMISVLIDKALNPLWHLLNNWGDRINLKFSKMM